MNRHKSSSESPALRPTAVHSKEFKDVHILFNKKQSLLPCQSKTQLGDDSVGDCPYLSMGSASQYDLNLSMESMTSLSKLVGRQPLLRNSDLELQYLDKLESDIKDELRQLSRRGAGDNMSESDYSRRRDELKKRLRGEDHELKDIIEERDQALKDKKKVESAIADVQEKFERVLKTVIALKEKEELLIERDNENLRKVKRLDKELEEYKETARKQVESEYQNWLEKLAEAEATNLRLKGLMRKAELNVEKLEHSLGQKSKENGDLHNFCDELISNSSRKNSMQN